MLNVFFNCIGKVSGLIVCMGNRAFNCITKVSWVILYDKYLTLIAFKGFEWFYVLKMVLLDIVMLSQMILY